MTENGKKIAIQVSKSEKLKKELNKAKDVKEAVNILNANGFKCSAEDFASNINTAKNCKLSIEEASSIAGGTTCACVVGGGGDANCFCVGWGEGGPIKDDGNITCFCIVGGGSSW